MTDQVRALVVDVQRFSVHDGPGIRTTVFFKGCPLRCAWCQNPESLRPEPEPNVGRWVTVDELLEEVRRDGTFYGADGGVTLSGGEPTLQHEFLRLFVPRCVKAGLSVGLQTCGAYSHSALESLLGDLGFVYFDLKLMDRAAHKQHTSADNRTILANARRLVADGTTVLFRIPLIPSITDTPDNLSATADFLEELDQERIHLLAYHPLGEAKLARLGFPIAPLGLSPDPEALPRAVSFLESRGLTVST
ncbi:MAG: radical SAM protein [Proteobacteria bacterium]|nr:radical SAM protein [Pseudomonadota bacterium]